DKQIKRGLHHFLEQTGLTWDALLGPFERLAAFRLRAPQLQSLVMRLANLVAKADGRVTPQEVRQLQWIQAESHRVLDRLPLCSPDDNQPASGRQALKPVPSERPPMARLVSEPTAQK